MRRVIAVSAIAVVIGGSATFALVGRHPSPPPVAAKSAIEAPRVETARVFAAPNLQALAPDLIATKLMAEVASPEVPKPVVKPKTTAAKMAPAPQVKSKPKPSSKPKKQVANATGSR